MRQNNFTKCKVVLKNFNKINNKSKKTRKFGRAEYWGIQTCGIPQV